MNHAAKDALASPMEQELEAILEMLRPCMQCGTCTASCPNAFAMRVAPRKLWRMLLFGLTEEALDSADFWMCSSCYTCTLRCPRGLPLTEAMGALKRLAARWFPAKIGHNATFYQTFMKHVGVFGRVQETALMARYFLAMRSPVLPLAFTPLGLRLLGKGKLHPPFKEQKGRLRPLFARARGPEERP